MDFIGAVLATTGIVVTSVLTVAGIIISILGKSNSILIRDNDALRKDNEVLRKQSTDYLLRTVEAEHARRDAEQTSMSLRAHIELTRGKK